MIKNPRLIVPAAAALLPFAFCSPSSAHHSLAAHYDMGNVARLTGVIESVEWRNPHATFEFAVENEDGELVTWRAEAGAINTLTRNGVSRDLFQIGETITIIGPVSRSGRPEMIAAAGQYAGVDYSMFPAVANALPDLTTPLEPGSELLRTAAGYEVRTVAATDIFRVWAPVEFPATGVRYIELPLTDQARMAFESYDPVAGDLANACVEAGMPSMLDNPYPAEFIDQGDVILMRLEEWNATRTIHMQEPAPPAGEASIFGHSVGRWDGGTLVIETTNISYPFYDDAGAPMTEDMVVVERYTLRPDGSRLDWTATSTDPSVFTEPVTVTGSMAFAPEIEIKEFHCVTD